MVKAIINGYGVSKNIFTDLSYHAYLTQVLNYLYDRYRKQEIVIIPCGGKTDFYPPYKRTEAGEMSRWLRAKINELGLRWQITPNGKHLTAFENIISCVRFIKRNDSVLYFCENTRKFKMKRLVKEILGSRVKVVPIEFDASPPRYQNRINLEKENLAYDLLALQNLRWRKLLLEAAKEKICALRKISPEIRGVEIDKISCMIRKKYFEKFQTS